MGNEAKKFNESELWEVLKNGAKEIGREVVYHILLLFYAFLDPTVPLKHKMVIMGALIYLIVPVDLIPDGIPVYGWSDDAAVIMQAVIQIASSINEDIRIQAEAKCTEYFDQEAAAA